MKKYFYILLLPFLFACEKEEEPIKAFDRGGIITASIETGNNGDYSKQIYYDLSENKVVRTINRTSWDLGFETTPTGTSIKTNTSCKMYVAKTGFTHLDSIKSISSLTLDYKWDYESGNPDSLALRDWIISGIPTNEVFIIDRGEKPSLSSRGFKKMQIISVSATQFKIKYANIDGTDEHTKVIAKNTAKNYTCFSFEEGGKVVEAEPDKDKWDLLFSQYITTFNNFDPIISYSVNGTLLNDKQCMGVKVFDKSFASINLSDLGTYNLSDSTDVIGYNWKYYDLDAGTYVIAGHQNYLIQDRKGFYYKIRFIDFYNDAGIKGSPKFEFEKM